MPSASDAKLQYEAGQTPYAMAALTTSDRITFAGAASPWSGRGAFAPIIRPNGLLTGGAITPGASANTVNVAGGTCWIGGVEIAWPGATLTLTRPTGTTCGTGGDEACTHSIASITIDIGTSPAGVAKVTAGVFGKAYATERGTAGAPPVIPVDEIEIGQVRMVAGSAVFAAGDIYQVPGLHMEMAAYPSFVVDDYAGTVTFVDALPAIHTGSPLTPKAVYASYATPIFADISIATDFVPSSNSYSVTSTQVYGRTVGNTSQQLTAGSFTAHLDDGANDPLLSMEGEKLWFKFFPSRYKSSHIMDYGRLGIARRFPAGDAISAACTIAAESAARNVAG
jgi:hypothetical protein